MTFKIPFLLKLSLKGKKKHSFLLINKLVGIILLLVVLRQTFPMLSRLASNWSQAPYLNLSIPEVTGLYHCAWLTAADVFQMLLILKLS